MASYFENLPDRALQNIALYSVVASNLRPPQILQLMLISHTIYNALRFEACPELYADLFCIYFDCTSDILRPSLTSAGCRASELVHRFDVLRRIRLRQFSDEYIRTDLWTAYLMVLESDGQNEAQLAFAGISEYILQFIRKHIGEEYIRYGLPSMSEVNSLALWLACLTVSPHTFTNESPEGRDELYDLLRPFVIASGSYPLAGIPASQSSSELYTPKSDAIFDLATGNIPVQSACKVIYYSQTVVMTCPRISSASILLAFILKNTKPLDLPPHLPQTRAIADALQRDGPTVEDYVSILQPRTPSVADPNNRFASIVGVGDILLSRSMRNRDDFSRAVSGSSTALFHKVHAYAPGMLTGLWEGQYMASPLNFSGSSPQKPSDFPDFLNRHPMQFKLREEFGSFPDGVLPDASALSHRSPIISGGDTRSEATSFPTSNSTSSMSVSLSDGSGENVQAGLEAALFGESVHDKTCGAFEYFGKVRFRDGLIVLRRELKKDADQSNSVCAAQGHGAWVFEGYLHTRQAFVGQWHSTPDPVNGARMEGVFCMSKFDSQRPDVVVRDTSWSPRH